jgi:hypothetical protein
LQADITPIAGSKRSGLCAGEPITDACNRSETSERPILMAAQKFAARS